MDFSLSVERNGELHNLLALSKDDHGPAPEQNRGFRERQKVVFPRPIGSERGQ